MNKPKTKVALAVALATTTMYMNNVVARDKQPLNGFAISVIKQPPETFSFKNGTLSLEMTMAGHVSAFYNNKANGRHLDLVVIRGEANNLDLDPDAPPYVIDIRVSDQDGFPIVAQRGSDHFLDPVWKKSLEKIGEAYIVPEQRFQDVGDLASFANDLRNQVQPALDKSEMSEWSWIIDNTADLMEYVVEQSDNPPSSSEATERAASTTYKNVVTINKKKAFGIAFEHSALSYSLYSSTGKFLYSIVTCNHGACASSSSMSFKCSKIFTQSTVTAFASDLLCDFYGSPYSLHTCNSDTKAEYLSIKNQARGTHGACYTPLLYAPSCD